MITKTVLYVKFTYLFYSNEIIHTITCTCHSFTRKDTLLHSPYGNDRSSIWTQILQCPSILGQGALELTGNTKLDAGQYILCLLEKKTTSFLLSRVQNSVRINICSLCVCFLVYYSFASVFFCYLLL